METVQLSQEIAAGTRSSSGNFLTTAGSTIYKNVFTICIFTMCGTLCLWQVGLSINQYINQPVVTVVKLETVEIFVPPSISLCYLTSPVNYIAALHTKCQNGSCSEKDLGVPKTLNDYEELYDDEDDNLRISITAIPCMYSVGNITDCKKYQDGRARKMTKYYNALGYCIGFLEERKFYFAPETSNSIIDINGGLAKIFYQIGHRKLMSMYDVSADNMMSKRGYNSINVMSMQKNVRIDRTNKPCYSDNDADTPFNHCIDKYLENTLPCRLPNQVSMLHLCSTVENASKAYTILFDFYTSDKFTKCSQKLKCTEFKYVTLLSDRAIVGPQPITTIEVSFTHNVKTIITEVFLYDAWQLWSEISGNLGFFLGLSIAQIFLAIFPKKRKLSETELAKESSISRVILFSIKHWSLLFVSLAYVLCTWQLMVFIERFNSNIIMTEVSLTPMKSLKLPYMTQCCLARMKVALPRVLEMAPIRNRTILNYFNDPNLGMSRLADEIGVTPSMVKLHQFSCVNAVNYTSCVDNEKRGTSVKVSQEIKYSPPGARCTTVTLNDEFYYNVNTSSIILEFKSRVQFFRQWAVRSLSLTENDIYYRHNQFYYTKELTSINFDVIVSMTQHHVINQSSKPCFTQNQSAETFNHCMDRQLEKILPCRLIYVQSSILPPCKSLKEIGNALNRAYDAANLGEIEMCPIPRICSELKYNFVARSIDNRQLFKLLPSMFLKIHFSQTMIQTFREKYEYTLSSLFTDISNSLGFCLGFSLIAGLLLVAKWFNGVVNSLIKKCCKM